MDVSTFTILPAIDLIAGRVVRLREGDFACETAYGAHPLTLARAFADAGAAWIHVVDLDGAKAGEPRQLELVVDIVSAVEDRVRIELGGGLRTPGAVERAFACGVSRVAVGTAAIRDPAFARTLVARHGAHRVAASIDVRDGLALGEGWRTGAPGVTVEDAVGRLVEAGVETFEVTAIERDGLMQGPDLRLLRSLVALGGGRIIASGGIGTVVDLHAVRDAGCAGAIVGRALYEGRIDLATAIGALADDRDKAD
jgi:phosphoribosylformimino-5-aminoimidazole carboxamide ribotide isomerase